MGGSPWGGAGAPVCGQTGLEQARARGRGTLAFPLMDRGLWGAPHGSRQSGAEQPPAREPAAEQVVRE